MPKPPDRVQLIKQESLSGGGDPNDVAEEPFVNSPLNADEDAPDVAGLYFQEPGIRDAQVTIYREAGKLYFEDTEHAGASRKKLTDLVAGSGGLTESAHEALDTLVHNVAENAHLEVVRSGGKVSQVIYWTNATKTTKIRETVITRTGGKVSQVVVKQYDGAGVVVTGQTLTGTVNRTGNKVDSIDWVES